jgi:hypothetical protein
MNSAYPIESTIRTSGVGRRIRAAVARVVSRQREELTREELAELRENRLMAERLRNDAQTFLYTVRHF